MKRVRPYEIKPGLVLHMFPQNLIRNEAQCSMGRHYAVRGGHLFLCVRVDGGQTYWMPLYSKDGPSRVLLPYVGRSGHPKWLDGDYYFHTAQFWMIPIDRVADCAVGDLSTYGHRNWLIIDGVLGEVDNSRQSDIITLGGHDDAASDDYLRSGRYQTVDYQGPAGDPSHATPRGRALGRRTGAGCGVG